MEKHGNIGENQPISENPIQKSEENKVLPRPRVINSPTLFLVLTVTLIFNLFVLLNQSKSSTSKIKPSPSVSTRLNQINHLPINDGKIIFTDSGQLFLLDTKTMIKTTITLQKTSSKYINELAITHDNKVIVVSAEDPSSSNGEFLINTYTLPNFKLLASIKRAGPSSRVSSNTISPNNKYMLIDESCCPGDFGRTIATLDGHILKELSGGVPIAWTQDSSILAISRGTYTLDLPYGPQPTNNSVFLEYIHEKDVTEKEVLKATDKISYIPLGWKDDHTLIYSQEMYSVSFPSSIKNSDYDKFTKVYENPLISYHTLNIETDKIANIDYTKVPRDLNVYSPSGKWKIFSEFDSATRSWTTYISRINGQDKFKISDHSFYLWLP